MIGKNKTNDLNDNQENLITAENNYKARVQHLYKDALIETLRNCSNKTEAPDRCKSCMFSEYLEWCVNVALDYAAEEIQYLCDVYNNLADEFNKIKNTRLSEKDCTTYAGNVDIEKELKDRLCWDYKYKRKYSDIDLLNYALIAIEELRQENRKFRREINEKQKEKQMIRTVLNGSANVQKYYSTGWNDAINNIIKIKEEKQPVDYYDLFNEIKNMKMKVDSNK